VIGGYGFGTPAGPLQSVERAAIDDSTGSLGTFATLTNTTMFARYQFASAVLGSNLYAISGSNQMDVERTTIDATDVGPFTRSGFIAASQRHGHTSALLGSSIYIIAGTEASVLGTVESATASPDGLFGSFTVVPGVTLATPRTQHTTVVLGNFLYVIGGQNETGSTLGSVEAATLQ